MATATKTKTRTTTSMTSIERHAKRIAAGKARVHPGQPIRISEAAQPGDQGWQGDLGIIIIDRVPKGYVLVEKPKAIDRQLVPGNTEGAKHCLESLAGVELWRPSGWPRSVEDDMLGPVIVVKEETKILHPTHGAVTIPAGMIVQCRYQREFDTEQQRARRNAD